MAGYSAPSTVRKRLVEADAVLVLGSRLNEITSFGYRVPAAGSQWAQVDLEPRQAAHGLSAPTIALTADIGRFVDEALSLLRAGAVHAETREARLKGAADDRQGYLAASTVDGGAWEGPGVHPGRVVAELRRQLSAEAIITTDAGNFGGWLHRGYRFRRAGTFLGTTAGAMGYGLPAAIAACLLHPRRQVVAMCGDGGFAMSMNELETAVRLGVSPVAIVHDNQRYGTIRMHQDREGRPAAGTDLGPIDFAAAAQAIGALGISVDRDDQVPDAIREALSARRPAVIHMVLDRAWVSVDQPAVTEEPVSPEE
jgi:acetolactate synthase-1/2/3 large subunit